ncbi:unnamed protein product, partial [Ixodes hexagonus]
MAHYLTHTGLLPSAGSSTSAGLAFTGANAQDLAQKEHLQQRHYALFRELQLMSGELPQSYQQRLPYELLSSLANSLLDGTVYEIVRGLKDIQLMDEKSLFETRKAVLNTQRENVQELSRRQKEQKELLISAGQSPTLIALAQQKEREALEKSHQEEINRIDMKIITKLDQCVS